MTKPLQEEAELKSVEGPQSEYERLSQRYNYVCKQYENFLTEKNSLSVNLRLSKEDFERKIKIKDNQIKAYEEVVHRLEVENRILKHRINLEKTSFFRNLFKF